MQAVFLAQRDQRDIVDGVGRLAADLEVGEVAGLDRGVGHRRGDDGGVDLALDSARNTSACDW